MSDKPFSDKDDKLFDCPSCAHKIAYTSQSCPSCGHVVTEGDRKSARDARAAEEKREERVGLWGCGCLTVFIVGAIIAGLIFSESDEEKAARQAEDAAKQAEREREDAAKQAEDKRKGFHCLSFWNGSHPMVKSAVKDTMKDPDSFDHIETRVSPVDKEGNHTFVMRFRGRNSFGGMVVNQVGGTYANDDCSIVTITHFK